MRRFADPVWIRNDVFFHRSAVGDRDVQAADPLNGCIKIIERRLLNLRGEFSAKTAPLAALAGVMAAPIYQVSPQMGSDLIIVVFAVVVIGGMGSILGSIVTGFGLGVIEGLTKVFYPEASNTVIFIIMAIVLLIKPAGLFGTQK